MYLNYITNYGKTMIRIPFELTTEVNNNITNWNETCARAIELFGLPGEKYTCKFNKDFLEFWFVDEKDAIMFELCCG
jgi:hypothetical protein